VIDSGIDGLALDSQGALYAISHRGVEVFNAKGEPLGIISVGAEATNLAFAGKDGKTLYVTTHASLLKIRMLAERYPERAK
jgi:gluconolactonase